jgi:pSer/pThr/pTyr-binding forkhead associated (FHA) protein
MNKGATTRRLSRAASNSMTFLARYEPAIVLLTGAAAGSEYPLQSDRIVLGRGPDVHFDFDDDHLSRQHAALELTSEGFQLRDLGSTNGISVNDNTVDVALLQHGDRFTIGRLTFQYVVQERTDRAEFEVSTE